MSDDTFTTKPHPIFSDPEALFEEPIQRDETHLPLLGEVPYFDDADLPLGLTREEQTLAKTLSQFEELDHQYQHRKTMLRPLEDEWKGLKASLLSALEFVPSHSFLGVEKEIGRIEKRSFALPETDEDVLAFIEFVKSRGKGGSGELRSILHSAKVNSYCEEIYNEQIQGGALEPEIPGIKQPYIRYSLSIKNARKLKKVK